jgi:hypothetical protein
MNWHSKSHLLTFIRHYLNPGLFCRYIVEQQYQKAVSIVLKTRSYVDSLDRHTTSAQAQKVLGIVNSRCEHLAQTIQTSLLSLPNSPLWGSMEQFKRLKLLVSLGELRMAAEGFAAIKRTTMQRALHAIDITSDTMQYCREVSRSFYVELSQAVHAFYALFEHQAQRKDVAVLIIQWIQRQIAGYAGLLNKHLALGVGEAAALQVMHHRQLLLLSDGLPDDEGEATQQLLVLNKQTSSASRLLSRRSTTLRVSPSSSSSAPPPSGGIALVALALHTACSYCAAYQAQFRIASSTSNGSAGADEGKLELLPLRSLVLHYSLGEVQHMCCHYLQAFIEEVSGQVRQDSWIAQKVAVGQVSVKSKGRGGGSDGENKRTAQVSEGML